MQLVFYQVIVFKNIKAHKTLCFVFICRIVVFQSQTLFDHNLLNIGK